jgi:hypothetical protein
VTSKEVCTTASNTTGIGGCPLGSDHIVGGMMLADESSIMLQRVQARNLDWPSAPRTFQSCRPNVHRKDRLRSPSKDRPMAPSSRGYDGTPVA